MTGPFAATSIVIEFETGAPEQYLRFDPDRPSGDRWLHRADEFDPSLEKSAVIDRYALPASDTYHVSTIEVPAGEPMRIGDVGGTTDRTGGGDLVELLDRDSIPESWIVETMTLEEFLE